ncbi:hypothetical protein NIA69_20180 [Gemmiger formicilis]|nr:hypothetical protein [Gemmiger formicilis]
MAELVEIAEWNIAVYIFLVKKKIEKVVEKSDSLFSYVLGGSKPPKK